MNPLESRRNFLKLGGLLAGTLLLESCGIRPKEQPFVWSPEKAEIGPGFATADFSGTAVDVYIPTSNLGGSDTDLVFGSESVNIGGMEHLLGSQSFHTAPDWWKLVDHDMNKPLLAKPFTLTDIRFSQTDPTLIRVIGDAPQMVGGKPDATLPWVRSVMSIAVQSGGDWLGKLSPVDSSDSSRHMVTTIQAIGSRVRRPDMLTPDEIVFAGAIVPKRYAGEMQSSLDLHKGLTNAVNAARDLSHAEGVSVPDDLYVSTYDAAGSVNPSLRLPMGLKVDIKAIHQLTDGRILALVKPLRESILTGYTPDDGGLIKDATSSGRMPTDLVWVDMGEFWTEQDVIAETAARQEVVAQGTPKDVVATKKAAFPTATATSTRTPVPTFTPQPTSTHVPTSTESQSFTGWQPTPGATMTEIPGGPNQRIAESDPWSTIILGGCTVSALAGAGAGVWVVRDFIRGQLLTKLQREASNAKIMEQLTVPRVSGDTPWVEKAPVKKPEEKKEIIAPAPMSREARHNKIRELTAQEKEKKSQLTALEAHGHDRDNFAEYHGQVARERQDLGNAAKALKVSRLGGNQAPPESHDQK